MGNWYIAKIKPGTSRAAPARPFDEPERRGENLVERAVRDAGFACFYPRRKFEIIHHRTKKVIIKEAPLFYGYIFVELRHQTDMWQSKKLRDNLSYLLGTQDQALPVDAIKTRIEAQQENLEFDDTRESRIRHKRDKHDRLHKAFPVGSSRRVKSGPFGGFWALVDGYTRKGGIDAVVSLFGRLVPVEFAETELEAA